MSVKYVKLNTAHTEWESALYSMKPRQIRRLTDEQAREHHWFPVKEYFSEAFLHIFKCSEKLNLPTFCLMSNCLRCFLRSYSFSH